MFVGSGEAPELRVDFGNVAGGGVSAERRYPLVGSSAELAASTQPVDEFSRASGETGFTQQRHKGPVWAHRFGVLLFVFFCAVLGMVLIIFPWRDEWTNNSFLYGYPALQDFMANGFVRGLCSGLGVIDIWIGFWEAVHYHE